MAGVKKRKIFYCSGFDPRGVRAAYALNVEEAAKYRGDNLHVGKKRKSGAYADSWTIKAEQAGVESVFTFLRWDDIIRARWVKEPLKLTLYALRAYWRHARAGGLPIALRCNGNIAAAALYPILTLLAMQAASFTAGAAVYGITKAAGLYSALAYAAGFAAYLALLLSLYPAAEKIKAFWLLRIYIFFSDPKGAFSDIFDKRAELFAEEIKAALDDDTYDEVLVIGHSAGAVLAVSASARALQARPDVERNRFSLLTLGHCIPLHSEMPQAGAYRDETAYLAAQPFFWLDVASPADGGAFARTDPCKGMKRDISVISPRFHEAFPKADYKKIKRDFFRMHFQYMMTVPQAVSYDYFAILAGDKTLRERYA